MIKQLWGDFRDVPLFQYLLCWTVVALAYFGGWWHQWWMIPAWIFLASLGLVNARLGGYNKGRQEIMDLWQSVRQDRL